jgi:phosphoglycolate phosphatase
MTYTAILFDLDGTLLNTLDDIGNAVNSVLSGHHFPMHPIDAYRAFIGNGVKMLITRALPEDKRHEPLIHTCMEEFAHAYAKNWNKETALYPGISEMLDLVQARGLALAILSNKPQEFTQYCVEEFLSAWRFAAVLGQQDSIPLKPDPTGALMIAHQIGAAPASFLYLGDSGADMQTARAAGMRPVGVLWGFRSLAELTASGADVVLHHPSEVVELLG